MKPFFRFKFRIENFATGQVKKLTKQKKCGFYTEISAKNINFAKDRLHSAILK